MSNIFIHVHKLIDSWLCFFAWMCAWMILLQRPRQTKRRGRSRSIFLLLLLLLLLATSFSHDVHQQRHPAHKFLRNKTTPRSCNRMEEDDSERSMLLEKISDLLLSGGYFRAQISNLSPFDKLTGGLAWSITASNVDVDFDVLYDDDATLGYKIKVGEAIEAALQTMECPYPLQAHQIQGLDYPAVLPVVQWLINRVIATRQESGDQLRRYSLWRFQQNYELAEESNVENMHLEGAGADSSSLGKSGYLLDHSLKEEFSGLELGETGGAEKHNSDIEPYIFHQQQTAALERDIEFQKARVERLQGQITASHEFTQQADQSINKQEEHLAQIEAEMAELKQIADAAGAGTLVPDLVILLNQSTDLELKEYQFRASCRKKRAELLTEIKQLQDPAHSVADDDEQRADVEAAFNADLQKWISLRTELAQKSQEVALLQRKLDDLPCQTELIQYERRFVELYVHIQRKLRETRKYYATYNALAEAHELTVKETSLLNSIHTQFEAAMMTTGGRSKFVESMDGIVKGVKQKLDKVERRFHAEQSTYNLLKEKHASAVAAQRHYFSLVKLFQDECARSEKLRTALESFAGIATKDIPPSPLELKAHEQTFVSPL